MGERNKTPKAVLHAVGVEEEEIACFSPHGDYN